MIRKAFWKKIESPISVEDNNDLKKIIDHDTNSKKLIEVKNLTQIYKSVHGDNIIFENFNFDIYENDKLAILGANGCGKTTIVECICGYKKPTSGEIIKNFEKDLNYSKQIGVQFQDLSFPRHVSVKDVIKFIVDLDEAEISEDELAEMLVVFDLALIIDKRVSKLSGGQQQRLNVILSLLSKPKLLFLDEFTTGLDIAIKNSIKKFILRFCKKNNITFVLISHDMEIMSEMVERVILITKKEIYIDASKETIEKEFGSLHKMADIYIK